MYFNRQVYNHTPSIRLINAIHCIFNSDPFSFLNHGLSKTFCGFTRASRQHQLLSAPPTHLNAHNPPPTAMEVDVKTTNGVRRGGRKFSACAPIQRDGVWEFSKRLFRREIPTHDVWWYSLWPLWTSSQYGEFSVPQLWWKTHSATAPTTGPTWRPSSAPYTRPLSPFPLRLSLATRSRFQFRFLLSLCCISAFNLRDADISLATWLSLWLHTRSGGWCSWWVGGLSVGVVVVGL